MAKVIKCVICGEPFVKVTDRQITCSSECSKENRRRKSYDWHHSTAGITAVLKEREKKVALRRSYLSRRDAEYAAHAAPVTVEQRQFRDSELGMVMRRIETRGNRFCGSLSGVHRQLVTDYGVVYVA